MTTENNIPLVQCVHCGALGIAPLYVCRKCHKTEFKESSFNGRGKVYTHTTIRVAPEAFQDQVPYDIAIIELTPEIRVTARVIRDPGQDMAIGQEVDFDRADDTGYWFRL